MKIKICSGKTCINATLRDTNTARAIADALPIESCAETWGEEVYFSVPISAGLETDAKDVIEAGEIAFWTEGGCVAIGYGKTPISEGDEIRLATRTNIWADAIDDVRQLASVIAGDKIYITTRT